MPVEVAPIAHYHMGGIAVDADMGSTVPGLYAAGEAVGGANGANRLSGNAIPEALVFGEIAGRHAARFAASRNVNELPTRFAADAVERIRALVDGRNGDSAATALDELRAVMWRDAGPFRDAAGLVRALVRIGELRVALPEIGVAPGRRANPTLADWFELRASLTAAEAVVRAALARRESRGAHQRNDFPDTDSVWARNQQVAITRNGTVAVVE